MGLLNLLLLLFVGLWIYPICQVEAQLSPDMPSLPEIPRSIHETADFISYSNSSMGIEFDIPSDWERITLFTENLTTITFQKGLASPNFVPASISLSIEKLRNVSDMDEYTQLTDNLLNSTFDGYHLVDSVQVKFADLPAIERTFTFVNRLLE